MERLREPPDITNLHRPGQWSSTSRAILTDRMPVRFLSAKKMKTICQISESHLLQDAMNASDIGSGDDGSLAACLAWSPAEISRLLRAELRRYRKVLIIVDALDEYSEYRNDCDSLLAEVEQLREYSNMMLTSRFVAPWIDTFEGSGRVEIAAKDRDVRRYLKSQITNLPKFVKTDLDLQELIVQTITEAVEGMCVPSISYSVLQYHNYIILDSPRYCSIGVTRCEAG